MSFALNFFLLARISQTFSESSKAILTYNGKFKKFALVDTISNLLRFLVIVFLFNSNASIDNYLIGQATFSVTYGIFSLFQNTILMGGKKKKGKGKKGKNDL